MNQLYSTPREVVNKWGKMEKISLEIKYSMYIDFTWVILVYNKYLNREIQRANLQESTTLLSRRGQTVYKIVSSGRLLYLQIRSLRLFDPDRGWTGQVPIYDQIGNSPLSLEAWASGDESCLWWDPVCGDTSKSRRRTHKKYYST